MLVPSAKVLISFPFRSYTFSVASLPVKVYLIVIVSFAGLKTFLKSINVVGKGVAGDVGVGVGVGIVPGVGVDVGVGVGVGIGPDVGEDPKT